MSSIVAVWVSFLIFIIIACHLGYRKFISMLDNKILCIRENLNHISVDKEISINELNQELYQKEKIKNDIDIMIKEASNKASLIYQQIIQELDIIVDKKNDDIKQDINRFYQVHTQDMREKVADLIFTTLKAMFEKELSSYHHEIVNEVSIKKVMNCLEGSSQMLNRVQNFEGINKRM